MTKVIAEQSKVNDEDQNSNNANNETTQTPTALKNPGFTAPNPLSKNQLKRQRKLAAYEELKKARRAKERAREKEKRAQGIPRAGPSRKELKQRQTVASNDAGAVRVAIDLDYDDLMQERDIAKCVKQCLRIYTINRRSQRPCQLHFTGLKRDGHIHAGFKKNDGWENWHVQYHFDATHADAFAHEEIVYLTCESDNVLERLETGHVYVIGGLVDHNHHKGLCHERATKAGLNTARLPLSEHVDMKTRSVLSTFHVFEILTHLAAGKSWTEAILQTLPMRKGAKAKQSENISTTKSSTNEEIQIESDNTEKEQNQEEPLS